MKNPLVEAINKRMAQPKAQRTVVLKTTEVPRETRVGETITVSLSGVVSSINDRGEVVLTISDAKQEEGNGKEAEREKVLRVVTQESHVGGA